jgi:cell surface protein SprA
MKCLLPLRHPEDYNDSERTLVWPSSNNIDIDLNELVDLKVARDKAVNEDPLQYSVTRLYSARVNGNTVTVKGNPNLSNIRTIFIGVRNASGGDNHTYDDGLPKSAEIWFNELRLTDFKNEGGWAANARTQVSLPMWA